MSKSTFLCDCLTVNKNFFSTLFLAKAISTPAGVKKNTVRCIKQLNIMHNKGSETVVHEQAKSKENRDSSKRDREEN